MFIHRPQQQVMGDVIKQTPNVKLDDPRVLPAPLACHADRIKRRFTRPIAVTIRGTGNFMAHCGGRAIIRELLRRQYNAGVSERTVRPHPKVAGYHGAAPAPIGCGASSVGG